jgi:hypothetical protein
MSSPMQISPFPASHESCNPELEELVQKAAATCDENAADIYDFLFNMESFAINSVAWFKSE